MLRVFRALDEWVAAQNAERRAEGFATLKPCRIQLLGQTALLLAESGLSLAATNDVDLRADYEPSVQKELERLLRAEGLFVDPVGHEAWMPKETKYKRFYDGTYVRVDIAEPDFVLLSKALKAPSKNRNLITEYLASGPSDRFMKLAAKYRVDLETFV